MPNIDPRVAALRGGAGGPQMGQPPNPYLQGLQQPVQPLPQSGLGLAGQGSAINAGGPPLTAGSANLVAGIPQANEQFAQGARQGDQADMLRKSSLEPIRGKMVGRVYVPASIAEGGAKLIQAYVARKKEQEQKAERAAATEEISKLRADYLRQFGEGAGETDRAMLTAEAGKSGR